MIIVLSHGNNCCETTLIYYKYIKLNNKHNFVYVHIVTLNNLLKKMLEYRINHNAGNSAYPRRNGIQ